MVSPTRPQLPDDALFCKLVAKLRSCNHLTFVALQAALRPLRPAQRPLLAAIIEHVEARSDEAGPDAAFSHDILCAFVTTVDDAQLGSLHRILDLEARVLLTSVVVRFRKKDGV